MGSAASSIEDLPERVDLATIEGRIAELQLNVRVDMVRFNLLRDKEGRVSRIQALQLIENKFPPIYSLNCLGSL